VPHANRAAQNFWLKALRPQNPITRDIHFDGDDWRLHEFMAVGGRKR
jgi:hypothetical protein